MGLSSILHGFGRVFVVLVSIPFLLIGLFFGGAALGDSGILAGGDAPAEGDTTEDLIGVVFGAVMFLIGGIGLYKGITGNLSGGMTTITDTVIDEGIDDIEDAFEEAGEGEGGFGGGFDGGDGGGGGGGGGGE